MPAAPGLISIVVVNWNGMAYIPECLEFACRQTHLAKELIVVDNGSADGSLEWLRTNCGRYEILVELGRNLGFAAGANAGIRVAHGEFIALLNNDAVPDCEWLEHLVHPMADPAVGMVASKIYFYDRRNVIDKVGHLLYPDGLNRGRGAGDVDSGQFDNEEEIFFPDGCAAIYRKSMLEDIGLFDEQFFAYGDDAELGLRARWRDWRCRYAPGAKVYHRHSSSLGKYSPTKAFLVERNRFWVAAKLFPWPLLLLTPIFTLWRFFWHVFSIVVSKGLAGGVTREHSGLRLLYAMVRAYLSGLRGIRQILKKRRDVFRNRKLSNQEFYALLRKYRISARELALRD